MDACREDAKGFATAQIAALVKYPAAPLGAQSQYSATGWRFTAGSTVAARRAGRAGAAADQALSRAAYRTLHAYVGAALEGKDEG